MQNELIKPIFTDEIKAEIKGVSVIENNILKVKEYALGLNKYYNDLKFTDENIDEAVEEKSDVNKFKDEVAKFRKNIISEYKKPIDLFETTAKETEKILDEVYKTINSQVNNYRDKQKEECRTKLKEYFEEYRTFKNIDESYLNFDELNINITLGLLTKNKELTKSSKEELSQRIDLIANDIETINSMQNAEEILVEYIKNKNLAQAIKEVNDRHAALEQVSKKQEELKEVQQKEQEVIQKVESVQAPVEIKEEIIEVPFIVRDTEKRIIELKQILEDRGYDYE